MANVKISDLTDETAVQSADRMLLYDASGSGTQWKSVSAEKVVERGLISSGDVTVQLGDAAGANKLSITDSGGVEVARINSDGSLRLAERKLQSVVKAGTSSSFFMVGFLVIPYDCTVTKVEFCSPNRTITADASNYWGLMVENATAGVDLLAAKYTTATNTITAGLPFDMGTLHGTASNLDLSANDVLVLDGDVEAGSPDSWFGSEVVIVLTVTEI